VTDDVTLSVTMSAEAFRRRFDNLTENGSAWAVESALAALDRAILAAPLPPPPEPRERLLAVLMDDMAARAERITDALADPPPPPPMKEPERGDVVTWDEDSRGTGMVFGFCTVAGTRYALIGDDGMTALTVGVDWITENHGPPEGDEWNGWEVGK
jgi:hypothetical protein